MINHQITLTPSEMQQIKGFLHSFIDHIHEDEDEDGRQYYSTAIAFVLLNALDNPQNSEVRDALGVPPLNEE